MRSMYTYRWVDQLTDMPGDITDLIITVSAVEPYVGLPQSYTEDDMRRLLDGLSSPLRNGRGKILIIVDEHTHTVGCVTLTRAATANQRHIGTLTTGLIHPAHRHRGIVAQAFQEVTTQCRNLGIDLLLLDVREGIPAEQIWRSFGFRDYGRLEDYGRISGESYAGVFMYAQVAHLEATLAMKEETHA